MYHNGGWSKMCRPCAKAKKGVDKDYSKGKDELITTTFKCPAEKCSVNTLKFKDFVLGSCCFEAFQKCLETYKPLESERLNLFNLDFGTKMLSQCKESKNEQNLRNLLNYANTILKNCYDQVWFSH